MLGGDAIDDRRAGGEIRHQDDGAVVAPARAGDVGARHGLELALDGARHGVGEGRIVGDQHRLRGGIVLGLRQEVGGDPGRIVLRVGHDQDLRRTGDKVDADLAEDAALGGGDIGVARAGDLVDRLDRLRAVGERRHGLRAADAPDLVGAGDLGRQHDQRIERRRPASARP